MSLIDIKGAKGVVHALLIPFMLFYSINHLFDGNWGLVYAIGYWIIPITVYSYKENDLNKTMFYMALSAIGIFFLVLTAVIMIALSFI